MQKQWVVGRLVRLWLAVLVVLGLGVSVGAQSAPLTVTSYSDAVRFAAQDSVKELRKELRVEILSLAGQKVFDSGYVTGSTLDWRLHSTQGHAVANGVYLFIATLKDAQGQVMRRAGKLAVVKGETASWGSAPPFSLPAIQSRPVVTNSLPRHIRWRALFGVFEDNARIQRSANRGRTFATLLTLDNEGKLSVAQLCLAGDCRGTWPNGGGQRAAGPKQGLSSI
jgi:hypothetical protein